MQTQSYLLTSVQISSASLDYDSSVLVLHQQIIKFIQYIFCTLVLRGAMQCLQIFCGAVCEQNPGGAATVQKKCAHDIYNASA